MTRRRIFLGTVAAVPRTDFKRHVERLSSHLDTDEVLQQHLAATFQLAPPPAARDATVHDYVMDLFVVRHQLGEASELSLGDLGLPLLWRPGVEVRSSIRALASGRTVLELTAGKTMAWGEFFRRALPISLRPGRREALLREDLKGLLDEAVLDILEQAAAELR